MYVNFVHVLKCYISDESNLPVQQQQLWLAIMNVHIQCRGLEHQQSPQCLDQVGLMLSYGKSNWWNSCRRSFSSYHQRRIFVPFWFFKFLYLLNRRKWYQTGELETTGQACENWRSMQYDCITRNQEKIVEIRQARKARKALNSSAGAVAIFIAYAFFFWKLSECLTFFANSRVGLARMCCVSFSKSSNSFASTDKIYDLLLTLHGLQVY